MTKRLFSGITERIQDDDAVSSLVEYIFISGILMVFMIITIPLVTTVFIEQPTNILTEHAFVDIGNGVSTRVVDLYAIIPFYNPAKITTKFDIPDDIAGKDYRIDIVSGEPPRQYDQKIMISRDSYHYNVSLAGIGATAFGLGTGNMTASGMNEIEYKYPQP